MILRARWIVDRSLRLHKDAWLDTATNRVHGSRLTAHGSRLDLGASILLPGLVNAHGHLDYTDMRGRIAPRRNFVAWLHEIIKLKRRWKPRDYARSIARGLDESLRFGTSAMANWVCHPETLPTRRAPPMRILWLWEQVILRGVPPVAGWDAWPARCRKPSALWSGGLAPHAPYTVTPDALRRAVAWSTRNRRPWSIHTGESREEFEMMRHARGAMFDLFAGLGREMADCGRVTPVGWMSGRVGNARAPCLLVHANQLEDRDIGWLASSRARRVTVVHCPRCHAWFRREPFPLARLLGRGVRVALGTDSLASNTDLSMFREMRRCAEAHPRVGARKILRLATLEGARAMGMEREWPRWRDWVAIPSRGAGAREVWRRITGFTGEPTFVMVDGKVVAS